MSDGDMPRIFEGEIPQYLASATAKAIDVLSRNRKGFVLMVEGSEIDDAGHSNSTSMVTEEILDLTGPLPLPASLRLRTVKPSLWSR
jgi:alkaline phosphatase